MKISFQAPHKLADSFRACLFAFAVTAGFAGNASAQTYASLIEYVSEKSWGISVYQNCMRPAQNYFLEYSGDTLIWRTAAGQVFVERLTYSGPYSFEGITMRSPSDPPGTHWLYEAQGEDRVKVTKNGRQVFYIVKCR